MFRPPTYTKRPRKFWWYGDDHAWHKDEIAANAGFGMRLPICVGIVIKDKSHWCAGTNDEPGMFGSVRYCQIKFPTRDAAQAYVVMKGVST